LLFQVIAYENAVLLLMCFDTAKRKILSWEQ